MRGGTDAVEPNALGLGHEPERTISDESGAEERCRLNIRESLWNAKAKGFIGNGVFRVAAIDLVAGEAGSVTQILAPASAIGAFPAGPAKPGTRPGRRP
jgi:hypothetical protein